MSTALLFSAAVAAQPFENASAITELVATVTALEVKLEALQSEPPHQWYQNIVDIMQNMSTSSVSATEFAALKEQVNAFIALDNARDGEIATKTAVAQLEARVHTLDAFTELTTHELEARLNAFIALDNARDAANATKIAELEAKMDSFIAVNNVLDGDKATTVAQLEAKLDAYIAQETARMNATTVADLEARLTDLDLDLSEYLALDNSRSASFSRELVGLMKKVDDGDQADVTITAFAALEEKVDNFIALDNLRDSTSDRDDVSASQFIALKARVDRFDADHAGDDGGQSSQASASAVDPFRMAALMIDISKLQHEVSRNADLLATDDDEDKAVAAKVKELELALAGYRDFEDLAIAGLVLGAVGFVVGLMGLGFGLSARMHVPSRARVHERHVQLSELTDKASPAMRGATNDAHATMVDRL